MMRKARRKALALFLGTVLFAAALFLFAHNQKQDRLAATSSRKVLAAISAVIKERQADKVLLQPPEKVEEGDLGPAAGLSVTDEGRESPPAPMPVIEVDGHAYIGYLSIPALDLELPVLSTCDPEGLEIAVCRQFGSIRNNDMTIAGHNYKSQLGKLHQLQAGAGIIFTDVEGRAHSFTVAGKEVVAATAVETVRNSGWDLTLYTCTYGGQQRLLVACRACPE